MLFRKKWLQIYFKFLLLFMFVEINKTPILISTCILDYKSTRVSGSNQICQTVIASKVCILT